MPIEPLFEHRHHMAIAQLFAKEFCEDGVLVNECGCLLDAFADMLAADNPSFDRACFLATVDSAMEAEA